MALDHGELNIPLAKRGNIDAQIDAYKREQAAQQAKAAKVRAAQLKSEREQAKAVLAAMPAEQLQRIADKASTTVAQARKQLQSIAYFTPSRVIALAKADGGQA